MCRNEVALNAEEFFAVQESSTGGWNCLNDEPDGNGRNDIWGCAGGYTEARYGNGARKCGPLIDGITAGCNSPAVCQYWELPSGGDAATDADEVILVNSAGGGVLCCSDETADPTSDPTRDPTMDPTSDPTTDPTTIPTDEFTTTSTVEFTSTNEESVGLLMFMFPVSEKQKQMRSSFMPVF